VVKSRQTRWSRAGRQGWALPAIWSAGTQAVLIWKVSRCVRVDVQHFGKTVSDFFVWRPVKWLMSPSDMACLRSLSVIYMLCIVTIKGNVKMWWWDLTERRDWKELRSHFVWAANCPEQAGCVSIGLVVKHSSDESSHFLFRNSWRDPPGSAPEPEQMLEIDRLIKNWVLSSVSFFVSFHLRIVTLWSHNLLCLWHYK